MNKYMIQDILRRDNGGINGLSIKIRRPQDRTIKTLTAEAAKTDEDLRIFMNSGAMRPLEDYWISGEGRTPIAIREVQTTVKGMKKYALLNPPDESTKKKPIFQSKKRKQKEAQKPVIFDVTYVYSEGIDFKKMVEDEAYAKAVIGLFQNERLAKKYEASYQLGSETIYIGTIAKTEAGYVKAGIKDYAVAIIGIDSQLQQQQQAALEEHQSILAAQKEREKVQERKEITEKLDRDGWKGYLKDLLSAYDVSEAATMLREAWEEKLKEQQATQGQTTGEEDFREWQ